MLRPLILALALSVFPLAAPAQERRPGDAGGEAWYQQQLVDLAGVLGGAHYLRTTCNGDRDQRWRTYMTGVIDRAPELRRPLAEAFNEGYRNEQTRFYSCNAEARQTEAELRARGLRISSALGASQ
jgi:uncharacterized protein (TIGR02301 family)